MPLEAADPELTQLSLLELQAAPRWKKRTNMDEVGSPFAMAHGHAWHTGTGVLHDAGTPNTPSFAFFCIICGSNLLMNVPLRISNRFYLIGFPFKGMNAWILLVSCALVFMGVLMYRHEEWSNFHSPKNRTSGSLSKIYLKCTLQFGLLLI